jgi:cellulose synthase/poly-beta-1,6-N-acetylglucosamine synthase-like glycosyltransferase
MIPFSSWLVLGAYCFFLYLIIFWLLVLARESKSRSRPETIAERGSKPIQCPTVTVAIPAWNEQENIADTLDSVMRLDYSPDQLEVIVVNDGSTDETAAEVARVIGQYPHRNLKLLAQPNRGKGAALNTALRNARGEFFAPMDADSIVRSDALRRMLPEFDDANVAAVIPLMKVWNPGNWLQRVQWCEYLVSVFYKHLMAILDCIGIIPGPFSVHRTRVLRELGGFEKGNITEDVELTLRLQKSQHKIVQSFNTEIYTKAPGTWRRFYRQRNRWYKGTFLNAWRYRKLALNTRYGDFGFIQMPRMITEGALVLALPCAVIYYGILSPTIGHLHLASVKGVDPSLHLAQTLSSMSFIDLEWPVYFLMSVLYTLGLILIRLAHRHAGEPMTKHGYFVIPFYLFVYWMLTTIVYFGVFTDLVRGKTHQW